MRLLFLTPQFPYPPHKGTTLRNYNLIAQLAQRHTIDLLSFHDTADVPTTPLTALCERIAVMPAPRRSTARRAADTLLSPWPDMALRLWSTRFADQLRAWLADRVYDVIQMEGIELARYARSLPWRDSGALLIFDAHNAEYLLQQRMARAERAVHGWSLGAIYSTLQARKLRRFERQSSRLADRVVCVSEADAAALRTLDPTLRPAVIPNGIDTSFYARARVRPLDLPPHSLVFTGTMDYRPNVDAMLWLVDQVWPQITAAAPDARLYIVGQRPHPRLDRLRGDPAITLTGAVDDTRPYIAGAGAYVIPLQVGGGTRFKLLEALALQAPVVSTTLGVEGFAVTDGREVLLADDAGRFAQAVLTVWRQPDLRRALGQAGLAFAARYDWSLIAPLFEEVYRAGLSPQMPPPSAG